MRWGHTVSQLMTIAMLLLLSFNFSRKELVWFSLIETEWNNSVLALHLLNHHLFLFDPEIHWISVFHFNILSRLRSKRIWWVSEYYQYHLQIRYYDVSAILPVNSIWCTIIKFDKVEASVMHGLRSWNSIKYLFHTGFRPRCSCVNILLHSSIECTNVSNAFVYFLLKLLLRIACHAPFPFATWCSSIVTLMRSMVTFSGGFVVYVPLDYGVVIIVDNSIQMVDAMHFITYLHFFSGCGSHRTEYLAIYLFRRIFIFLHIFLSVFNICCFAFAYFAIRITRQFSSRR